MTDLHHLRELSERASKGPVKVLERVCRLGDDRYLVIGSPDRWVALVMEDDGLAEDDAALIVAAVNFVREMLANEAAPVRPSHGADR